MSMRKSLFVLSGVLLGACGSGGAGLESAGGSNLSFVTTSVPDGDVGVAYTATLSVAGGSGAHTWTVASGELPPGIALDAGATPAEAILAGVPVTGGAYEFSIGVESAGSSVAQSFQMEVRLGGTAVGGWTPFTSQPGSRIIHVSNSGDDTAAGTEAAPKRTIAAGYAQLRNGYADWLLLKRGDTFQHTTTWQWNKCGPAGNAGWMRFGAYGDTSLPRPVLSMTQGSNFVLTPGFQASTVFRKVAITDIFYLAEGRLANSATTTWNPLAIQTIATQWQGVGKAFSGILVENCRFSGFQFGVSTGSDVEDLTIRRCIFDHIFGVNTGHASGVLGAATNWLLEDNIFYRIMSPDIAGLGSNAYSGFAHSVYVVAQSLNVVASRNVFVKASDPVMLRAGGVYSQNVCVGCNVPGNVGQAWGVAPAAGGVVADVRENLCLNSIGTGFFLGNTATGTIRANLLLEDVDGQGVTSFNLVPRNDTGLGVNIGVHNTTFDSNILTGTISYNPADTVSFSGLTFQGNQTGVGTTGTSMGSYLQSIGLKGNDLDDWASQLLQRDRANFTTAYLSTSIINFYRAYYSLPPIN